MLDLPRGSLELIAGTWSAGPQFRLDNYRTADLDAIEILKRSEGKTLEFKRDLSSPAGALKTVVAFANTTWMGATFRIVALWWASNPPPPSSPQTALPAWRGAGAR